MLSQELEFCLNDAFAGAREARHEFMTVEHLLLAIVDAPKVREILKSCGADTAKLAMAIDAYDPGPDWKREATEQTAATP